MRPPRFLSLLGPLLATAALLAGCGEAAGAPEGITVRAATPHKPVASTAAPTPTPTPTPPSTLTIAFTGDVMLDREVELAMATEGPAFPFERALPLFEGADLVVMNLEGAFTDVGEPLDKLYQFATDPALAAGLGTVPVWAVSLANNHATDYGLAGLERTLEALEEHGVASFGAGLGEVEARAPLLTSGVKPGAPAVALLGYSDIGETIFAAGASGGVSRASVEAVTADVRAARDREEVDFVVVTFHWGTEYSHAVTARQRELARAAVDAGADVVIGHHPHALQPIEVDRGAPVFYSLGNFVFDLDADDLDTLGEAPFQSAVALVTFEAGRAPVLELRPAYIDVAENRPRPATEEEAEAIRELLGAP